MRMLKKKLKKLFDLQLFYDTVTKICTYLAEVKKNPITSYDTLTKIRRTQRTISLFSRLSSKTIYAMLNTIRKLKQRIVRVDKNEWTCWSTFRV